MSVVRFFTHPTGEFLLWSQALEPRLSLDAVDSNSLQAKAANLNLLNPVNFQENDLTAMFLWSGVPF